MIDDLAELAAAAATDIAIDKTAKRHKWVRVLQIIAGIFFLALVVALIYVTVKYSCPILTKWRSGKAILVSG